MKHLLTTLCLFILFIPVQSQSDELEVVGEIKATSLAGSGIRLNIAYPSGRLGVLGIGSADQVLMTNGVTPFWGTIQTPTQNEWSLSGNTGTNPAFNFIGTRDSKTLKIGTNNTTRMSIYADGQIHIGSQSFTSAQVNIANEGTKNIGVHLKMIPGSNSGRFGLINTMESDPGESGGLYAITNKVEGQANSPVEVINNNINVTGNGDKYGMLTKIEDSPGRQVCLHNMMTKFVGSGYGEEPGPLNAVYNYIGNSNTDEKIGTYNRIIGTNGRSYGTWNDVRDEATNSQRIYGSYNSVVTNGNAASFAGYFDAISFGTGVATAALFNDGQVIMNESGRDNDLRVESENNEYALLVDADKDLIRVGSTTGGLPGNGQVLNGITQQYVADFDLGLGFNTGTTIGIGSNEYIVDGNYEIILNANFSPINHMVNDLGFSLTERAWDNVYGDEFINVSDLREKNSITSLPYGLKEILKLEPISYKLNKDPYQELKLGLVAQEVLAVIPEAVKTHAYKTLDENDKGPTKVEMERMGMNYQYLIPVIINATKEQQELIDTQFQLIQELRKEIEELKNGAKSNG